MVSMKGREDREEEDEEEMKGRRGSILKVSSKSIAEKRLVLKIFMKTYLLDLTAKNPFAVQC